MTTPDELYVCPCCGWLEGHSEDCDICDECSGDCGPKGKGHETTCSSWEPPDPWEHVATPFARNH